MKTSVTVLCFYFLTSQFQNKNVSFSNFEFPSLLAPILVLQFFMMVLNWSLELLRWKISLDFVERISWKQAAIDVLGGLTMNWILPFTAGDYLTRILSKRDKYKTTSAILLNRTIMFSLTFALGIFGMVSLLHIKFDAASMIVLMGIVILVLVLIVKMTSEKFLSYFKELDRSILTKIIGISVGRYLVFFLQFIILLRLFNGGLLLKDIIAGIGWIFFVRTSIPSLLGGLGLRETSAFFYFQPLISDMSTVILPVFLLWVLNTAIPSIFGALLLWKIKEM